MNKEKIYDIIGIGIGPFNLSLAALLDPIKSIDTLFLEKKSSFDWHPGLALEKSYLQSSFLRDLVTPVDPQSKHSFLSYLKKQGRLYQFLIADFDYVTRTEYSDYMKWVSQQLPSCKFGIEVVRITYENNLFCIQTSENTFYLAKDIVVGSGLTPNNIFTNNEKVFHSNQYCLKKKEIDLKGKKVAVIGGGQSGAEIFQDLLDNEMIDQLYWITRDKGFVPMDISPFVSEIYTPNFSEYFIKLENINKAQINSDHLFSSDGVSEDTLVSIYRELYLRNFSKKHLKVPLLLSYFEAQEFKNSTLKGIDYIKNIQREFEVDYIFCGTGYIANKPLILKDLNIKDKLVFNEDFSIQWKGDTTNKIFIQNMAKDYRGLADPNLSLMAWRSAMIINSILGIEQYEELDKEKTIMTYL